MGQGVVTSHEQGVKKRVLDHDSGVKKESDKLNWMKRHFLTQLLVTPLFFLSTNNNSNWSEANFPQFGRWSAVSRSSVSVADQNCGSDSSSASIRIAAAATNDLVANLHIQMFAVLADSQPESQRRLWWTTLSMATIQNKENHPNDKMNEDFIKRLKITYFHLFWIKPKGSETVSAIGHPKVE